MAYTSFSDGAVIFFSCGARVLCTRSGVVVFAFPGRVFDAVEHMAQALAPAFVEHAVVGVVLVDAHHLVRAEAAGLVQHQIQRQAHRQVGLERAVHGHQHAFGGLVQRGVGGDHAVQHGLAVLGFADLEVGRFIGGFDEVAGRIHLEQAQAFALDLAAKHHGDIEVHTGALEGHAIAVVHMAHGRAQHAGGIEHAGDVPDGQDLAGLLVADVLGLQDFTHRLRDRQIARRQQDHEAVARLLVDHHLAERADLVQSGIGAESDRKRARR
jgi:hypothetical protein